MSRRLLSTVATGALLLGLAACGDPNPGAVTTPPPDLGIDAPSDGGGEEPSDGGGEPTAEAPDIPPPDPADYAGMDQNTPEGAEQAFRYYIAVSIWAHQTGDTEELATLSGPNCGGCEYLNDDIPKEISSETLWSKTAVKDSEYEAVEAENFDIEVIYNFSLSPHSRLGEEGESRVNVDQLEYATVGGLDWGDGRWIVNGLSIRWDDDVF